ncbi:TIGR00730 family Rossman fold protein [Odoribacter lunatus]|uniref:LOG family protein n=1 Tax=Odoribacter lunatus TaxID=2941335 RepID=UPI0020421BB2|nr:TIGR00730 family Rossman fold protein [Odoribacter lunatus]
MNVAVFCASSERVEQKYFEAAKQLGEGIAACSWDLVYGGTNCGLMRCVAEAALQGGREVRGVIPRCIAERGVTMPGLTELIVTESMKERKQLMRDMADAFVVLPGGWGTLEEVTEVITLKKLGEHRKPIVFVDTDGFYEFLWKFTESAINKGFISDVYHGLYEVVDSVDKVLNYIRCYKANIIDSKY